MLPAVAFAGAHGGADDERNLRLCAAHVVPLPGLVRDLVGRHEREVHVHKLYDRPEPGHRRPDRRAADAGLGDRRVEDALAAESLEQILCELEGSTVVGYVLAVDDHAPVAKHLFDECLAERVFIRDYAIDALGHGRIGIGHYRTFRVGNDVCGSVRVKVLEQIGRGRVRCFGRANRGAGVAVVGSRLDVGESGCVGGTGVDQLGFEPFDWIDGPPGRLFVPSAVLIAGIGEGVTVVAVGAGLDQDWAMSVAADRCRSFHRVANSQDVHAIDDLGVHVVLSEAGRATSQMVDTHHFFVRAMGHPVVVVHDQVDHRKTGGSCSGEVVRPLILRSPVERLEDDAVGIGAVAGEAADDSIGAAIAQRHGRTGRDRDAASDDGVRAEMAGREVADMHAAAPSAAVALLFAE